MIMTAVEAMSGHLGQAAGVEVKVTAYSAWYQMCFQGKLQGLVFVPAAQTPLLLL